MKFLPKKLMQSKTARTAKRIARGWTQPSKAKTAKFKKLIEEKAERKFPSEHRLIPDRKTAQGFRIEKTTSKEHFAGINEMQSRIAATAALDAAGISRNSKENKTRELIARIAKNISLTKSRQARKEITTADALNRQEDIRQEIEKVLGKARAKLFLLRYNQIIKKFKETGRG